MCAAKKLAEYPKLGITWFFRVTINGGGTRDLGRWSSCSGLEVSFEFEKIKQMGIYDHELYLPKEHLQYNKIVLERAMNKQSSKILRDWVQEVAEKWFKDDGEPYQGNDITITMFDNVDKDVMSWTFRNAIPVKWSGPQLSAEAGKVAIEKLEFVHQGFLSATDRSTGSATTSAPAGGGLEKASLKYVSETEPITFQYNPVHLKISQNAATDKEIQASSVDEMEKARGVKTFEFGQVHFTGTRVTEIADKLFEWLEPDEKDAPTTTSEDDSTGAGEAKKSKKDKDTSKTPGKKEKKVKKLIPKQLLFTFGGTKYDVVLTKVDVDYTRFSATGKPIRATVGISLKEWPKNLPKTNPTSGGPGGGAVHIVTAGDSLPGIATATYGAPSEWRTIAGANGIDDPLRVRPGDLLYLPSS